MRFVASYILGFCASLVCSTAGALDLDGANVRGQSDSPNFILRSKRLRTPELRHKNNRTDWKNCRGNDLSLKFKSCNRLLQSGRLKRNELAHVYLLRGVGYARIQNQIKAISDYTKAIQIDPEYVDAYHNRGNSYRRLTKHKRAISDYTKAIQIDPGFAFAYAGRGHTYDELKQYERAITDYTKAIQIDPVNASTYHNRAAAYYDSEQYGKATLDLRKAVSLYAPSNPWRKKASDLLASAERKLAATQSPAPDTSTGSGFIINSSGYVVTNQHVVDHCTNIEVKVGRRIKDAVLLAEDNDNDLALLKLQQAHEQITALPGLLVLVGNGAVRAGTPIAVLGFPLQPILAEQVNVTAGTVSATAGPNNDTRYIQITAPVQPGNSGGPVIDMAGRVIGVVTATFGQRFADQTGVLPQNINFAIKVSLLRAFLDAHEIDYSTAGTVSTNLTVPDVADMLRPFTVLVRCGG